LLEHVKGDDAARQFLEYIRIGKRVRGLSFLRELAVHFSRLPYENISKIIKSADTGNTLDSMRLPGEVVVDHIERGFGGTCFSLTFFLDKVLKSLGFDAYKVMADMNSGPNVHCLVVVSEGGKDYIIDPGYALSQVMELPGGGTEHVTCPHAEIEIVKDEELGSYNLLTNDATGRKWRYALRNEPVPEEDFERFWIDSFGRPTLNNICLTRMTPDGHIYLRRDFFKFTSRDGVSKRRLKRDIEHIIEDEFGISGEWTERAQRILNGRLGRNWQK
jgi:arylamine N-acetyltransferase